MKTPIILAYFAEHPERPLDHVKAEAIAVSEFCERSALKLVYKVGPQATVEQLKDDIKFFADSIVAFHYSGHAGGNSLAFDGEAGHAEGIANLLGTCENLRLVFLNGCSTRAQADALFVNNVRVVVATEYAVRDMDAYRFARAFYETLFHGSGTMLDAFREAVLNLGTSPEFRALLPDALLGTKSTIMPQYRGTFAIPKPNERIWAIVTGVENDPILDTKDWYPHATVAPKIPTPQLERAYTCGRSAMSSIFYRHYEMNRGDKKVLHYFVIDSLKNSPAGLSIKVLFENITKNFDASDATSYFHLCDPNHGTGKGNSVGLNSTTRTEREILQEIFRKVDTTNIHRSNITFQALYDLPAFKGKKYLFLFFSIGEQDYDSAKEAIKSFITTSIQTSAANTAERPLILFFWHIIAETKTPALSDRVGKFFNFLNIMPGGKKGAFRKCVAEFFQYTRLEHVSFLHDYRNKQPLDLVSLPDLNDRDLEQWLDDNAVADEETRQIFSANRTDINSLERKFRDVLERNRRQALQ